MALAHRQPCKGGNDLWVVGGESLSLFRSAFAHSNPSPIPVPTPSRAKSIRRLIIITKWTAADYIMASDAPLHSIDARPWERSLTPPAGPGIISSTSALAPHPAAVLRSNPIRSDPLACVRGWGWGLGSGDLGWGWYWCWCWGSRAWAPVARPGQSWQHVNAQSQTQSQSQAVCLAFLPWFCLLRHNGQPGLWSLALALGWRWRWCSWCTSIGIGGGAWKCELCRLASWLTG